MELICSFCLVTHFLKSHPTEARSMSLYDFSCRVGCSTRIKPTNILIPGRYACQLVPRSPLPSQDISVLETKLRLLVSVLPQTNQPEVKSFPLSLPFLPPFYTHNAEIHVSTLTPLSSLRISSVAALAGEIQVIFYADMFLGKP